MLRLRPLLAAAIGILAGLAVSAARADEAFLCADGRIVYVAFGKLDEMKRTDPCVAAYYGLKIEAAASAADGQPTGATKASSPAAPVELPALRPLEDADAPRRVERPSREAATRQLPVAAPDTDYRRIRIINAAAGDGGWFHHAR